MTAQHTPGPWSVGQYTATPKFRAVENHACVCDPETLALIATCGPADDLQSQHDADLIAAAPDLLESLRECLSALRVVVGVVELQHIAELDLAERAEIMAQSAIAKATGG